MEELLHTILDGGLEQHCAQLWLRQLNLQLPAKVKNKTLRAILFDLQSRQTEPTQFDSTIFWVDNTAALAVANGNDFTHETLKVQFIQECVQRKRKENNNNNGWHKFVQSRIFRILCETVSRTSDSL